VYEIELNGASSVIIQVKATEHFSGSVSLDLVARATEKSNGDTAEAVKAIDGFFSAIADAPYLTVAETSPTANEDHTVNITVTSLGLVDTDGSETLVFSLLSNDPNLRRVKADGSLVSGTELATMSSYDMALDTAKISVAATQHFAGRVSMVLVATVTEELNGQNRST
jgi:hypothetical protein